LACHDEQNGSQRFVSFMPKDCRVMAIQMAQNIEKLYREDCLAFLAG